MANKLKDIFSDNPIELGGKVRFETPEAYEDFKKALKSVWDEGKAVEVKGVAAISTGAQSGRYTYPFWEEEPIDMLVVAPSVEEIAFPLKTENGEETFVLKKYDTKTELILETEENAIVYLKLKISKMSTKNTFSYRLQTENAKNMGEVVEAYRRANAFVSNMFKKEALENAEESDAVAKIRRIFADALDFYQRVQKVEKELNLQFDPKKRNEKENDEKEFEELYALIYEKNAFRLRGKMTAKEGIDISGDLSKTNLAVGSRLSLTFKAGAEFLVYGQTIPVFTANLLTNIVVKEIEKMPDGKTKVWYSDTDSAPMRIAYTAFLNEEERDQELDILMEHKEKYLEAVTVEEYLNRKGPS